MKFRIGLGKDIHKFKRGYKLILGGVEIPYKKGLVSYTDGDCLIHSLIDAIFGGISNKDIGRVFPNNDPKYKNVSSTELLKETKEILDKTNYKISNIDIFISCEKPKLASFIDKMRENIADILNIGLTQVSIKAGTNERLGYIGKGKGIECISVVLLEEK